MASEPRQLNFERYLSGAKLDSIPTEIDLIYVLRFTPKTGNERIIIFHTPEGKLTSIFSNERIGRCKTKIRLFRGVLITCKIEPIDKEKKYHRICISEKNFPKICGLFALVRNCSGATIEEKLDNFKNLPLLTKWEKEHLFLYSDHY